MVSAYTYRIGISLYIIPAHPETPWNAVTIRCASGVSVWHNCATKGGGCYTGKLWGTWNYRPVYMAWGIYMGGDIMPDIIWLYIRGVYCSDTCSYRHNILGNIDEYKIIVIYNNAGNL